MINKRKKIFSVSLLYIFLLTVLFSGLIFGSIKLSPAEIISALSGKDETAFIILIKLRFPRVAAAALAGIALSCAGTLLQTVTDNDLCAPNIIGVNSGAGFAVMLFMCLLPSMWRLLPIAAFFGAILATAIVLTVSLYGQGQKQRSNVVLAGVAVSSLLNAGISFLSVRYPDTLSSYASFSVGSFSGVTYDKITLPATMILICFAVSIITAPKTELLCLGDETASSLGVRLKTVRATAVIISGAMCAATVSFAGMLGFVGLIVPHITKKIFRVSLRFRLILGAAVGASVTVLSDLLGRVIFAPGEIPAGIFMAAVGAPFFICLLIRKRGRHI